MSSDDLERKLIEKCVSAASIKMSNSSTMDVQSPGDVIMGETSATLTLDMMPDERGFRIVRSWRTVSIAHVVEFIDIEPPKAETRRRKSS